MKISTDILGNRQLWTKLIIVAVAVTAVLIFRRPSQLFHPYVWVEEGTVTLPQYLQHGWLSLFSPVAGYLVVPAKLIFMLAASFSFLHLPDATYWLTVGFTIFVAACVALCPTYLKWPTACAIAMLLIPTDSEVFAVSEYAFWWGTLLVVLSVLWSPGAHKTILRSLLTTVGGLSSPLVILLTPLFLVRALYFRRRDETLALGLATTTAAVQAASILVTGNLSHSTKLDLSAAQIVRKFFGYYVLYDTQLATWKICAIGGVLLITIAAVAYRHRAKLDLGLLLLFACLIIAIASSVTRNSVTVIDPVTAGPRYFFFPYIFLSWLIIQIAHIGEGATRLLVALVIALSVRQAYIHGQRTHDTISWTAEIQACVASSADYQLPIHYDGARERTWKVDLTGQDCRKLISESLF